MTAVGKRGQADNATADTDLDRLAAGSTLREKKLSSDYHFT